MYHFFCIVWLGVDSSVDEQGAAALLSMQLDDSMGGKPVQVRVPQGKEVIVISNMQKAK